MMFCVNVINNARLAANTVCHLNVSNYIFLSCHQYNLMTAL